MSFGGFWVHCCYCRRESDTAAESEWLRDKLARDGWVRQDNFSWACPACDLAIHTDATVGGWR